MNDFTERIAAIITQHDSWDFAGGLECRCGEYFCDEENGWDGTIKQWSTHVAGIIVTEMIG